MSIATYEHDLRMACRAKLDAMAKATLTSTALSFSGATIVRTSGSFLDDGFDEGDSLLVAGAATAGNNGTTRITAISDLVITTAKTFTAGAAGPSITLTAKPPAERAQEGRSYQPTLGVPFVDETITPVFDIPDGIGQPAVQHHSLVQNFVLVYPADRGTRPISLMAGAILKAFRPGTSISYGNSAGMVMRAERKQLIQEPNWLRCPVQITVDVLTED